ncbi:MAG TPA: ribosome maturation factor RimM [Leptospiraceae bacterium]|nr:ribosome maturation factor RimM [Leptospiraceae bacterium]HMW04625.1 ribosome maturation factor RimM [Leptospiraceae bacterium]HMX31654.1 ribosome maturation factor RimM [Leptospiraceae bacterium]HMY30461.1 ribosome maturation factor RimM [Leptospiraceae bacterium]HMZ66654.1 ribosome maturation factor RimM [Leptospiraceae bacterium]
MTNDYISIGKIRSTFGLKGHLKVFSDGDILSSLEPHASIYINENEDFVSYEVETLHGTKPQFILQLKNITLIEQAEKLIGKVVYYPKKKAEAFLEEGELFTHQLIGLVPYFQDKDYSPYILKEVISNPVHPILLFENGSSEILVPYINEFVGEVDLSKGRIEILNWEDWLNAN